MRFNFLALAVVVGTACNPVHDFRCEQDASCDLSTGGLCVATATTGSRWCAYPSVVCPSGYSYSKDDVGDGMAGTCTESIAPVTYVLTVSVGGNGTGSVTSVPPGLVCATGTCTGAFASGTQVQLTATAQTGSFLGWSNACVGLSECAVTMDGSRGVGALFGIPVPSQWIRGIGNSGNDLSGSVAVDGGRNVVVVGSFEGTVQIGTTTLLSAGKSDIFIAKLSAMSGDVIWAKRFGGVGDDVAHDVAIDASDAIYVTGNFQASVDFGGGALQTTAFRAGYVLKLTADGDHTWSHGFGGVDANKDGCVPGGISVNASGVAITASYTGSLIVDGVTRTSAGNNDILVFKLNTDGTGLWSKSFGGSGFDSGRDVAIDASGDVVVTGDFLGPLDFGGGPLASGPSSSVVLLKLASANGAHLFSKRFGSSSEQSQGLTVAADSDKNIYVAGGFYGTGDFGGPTPLIASHLEDAFVAKYSAAGAYMWAKAFGGTGDDEEVTGISTGPSGDVAITGNFCGVISFGGGQLTAASQCPSSGSTNAGSDMFAVRLSGVDGSHFASVRGGGTRDDQGSGVVLSSDGRMFVTGSFEGFSEFGGQTLTSAGPAGTHDVFLVALPPL
jgi:hypothetical protein